jgi:predicted ferric reductase
MHLLGLGAWLLFSLSFVLAPRSRLSARLLGGIARQHRIHHWLGLGAGLAVLAHVLYEIVSAPESAFAFDDPYLLLGWIAAGLLWSGLFFSLNQCLPHRLWLLVHWSLTAAFVAAGLHGALYLFPDRLDTILFYVGAGLAVASTAATLLVRLFGQTWEIVDLLELSPILHEIRLRPGSGRIVPGFQAGSIVYVQFGTGFSRGWHPFSVASCQYAPVMSLLVKNAGTDTSHLSDLHVGDSVRIAGPYLEFPVSPRQDQFWLAAGVGLAPFLGLTRCLDYRASGKIRLLGYEATEEPALARELLEFQQRYPYPHFAWRVRTTPRADFSEVPEMVAGLSDPVYLVCGPPAFMKAARKFLVARGVSPARIHTEEFRPW